MSAKIFLTSDSHFFHTNVIRYCGRPFTTNLDNFIKDSASVGYEDAEKKAAAIQKDVVEMNDAMVRNWNAVVSPEDIVYHLGDFAFAARAVEYYTPLLNGKKILVLGNHDFPHPSHKKGKKPENRAVWEEKYKSWGWSEIMVKGQLEVPGIGTFNLHHIPYSSAYTIADEEDRQYKVNKYAAVEDGLPLLCGHVHEKWGVRKTPNGSIMINVGVDSPGMPWTNQYRPATLQEIIEVYDAFQRS
jgi:calcineurin-like phosphoesterase family protein